MISLEIGYAQNNLIQYTSGDGNDSIVGFNETSTLKIGDGTKDTYSTHLSGDNVIVSVGEGQITLAGAATLSALNIQGKEIILEPIWNISGTTATYGTTAETLITVSGVNNADGVSLDKTKKVVTVSETSLGTDKVTVSDGYTLKLGKDVTKTEQKKVWSFDGESVATYKDATIAGYSLAADEKSIDYTKAASKTLATVTGVKSADGLTVSGDTITVSKKSLGTDKVTVSDGYNLALDPAVDNPVTTDATWTMDGTTAIYKSSSTTAGYTLADNAIIYSKAKAATTLAQIGGAKTAKGISISDTTIKAAASALANDISVSGDDYEFNFDAKYTKAKISGTTYDEFIKSAGKYITIDSGKGDDTIISSGSNMSISASGGNNYIQLAAKTSDQTVQTSAGFDTVESNAQRALIETKGGSDYITNAGANASISAGDGNDTIINSGANVTIQGGKGNDLLTGGTGADSFVYANGDGNDVIVDYAEEDTIQITSGKIKNITASGSDVVFTIGSGKITVLDTADKIVSYIDASGQQKTYGDSASNVLEDDNFITGSDLSSLVQSNSTDYFVAEVETSLKSAKTLPALSYSSKK